MRPETTTPPPRAPWRRRWGMLTTVRRFRRGEDGVVAIEFAIVSVPFFGLLFMIIETGLVFFAGQILETAVADTGRLVLTGQAQAGALDQAAFKAAICAAAPGVLTCNDIKFDMRPLSSFSGSIPTIPLTSGPGSDLDESGFVFDCGGPSDIIMLRAFYRYPVYTSILGPGLGNILSNKKRLLMGASSWQNEPFGGGACTP